LEGNGGCSTGLSWWTDQQVNGSQNQYFGGVASAQSFYALDESVPSGTSSAELFDFDQFFDFDLLTRPENEPQNQYPPGISQFVDGGIGRHPQSQFSQSYSEINVQRRSPSSLINQETAQASSSTSPSADWSTRSISPLTNSDTADEVLQPISQASKMEISPAAKSFTCPTCKEFFSSELRYRQHHRRGYCSARQNYKCDACERTFTLAKDLKRHQGSASSCPAATKQQKKHQFTCTCGNTSTRKDTLLRHFQRANARDGDNVHKFLPTQA
jgi:RNase P subunit RPR2